MSTHKFNANNNNQSIGINDSSNKSFISKDNNNNSHSNNNNKNNNSDESNLSKFSIIKKKSECKIWGSKKTLNQIVESDERINTPGKKDKGILYKIMKSDNLNINEDSTKISMAKNSNLNSNMQINTRKNSKETKEKSEDRSEASFISNQILQKKKLKLLPQNLHNDKLLKFKNLNMNINKDKDKENEYDKEIRNSKTELFITSKLNDQENIFKQINPKKINKNRNRNKNNLLSNNNNDNDINNNNFNDNDNDNFLDDDYYNENNEEEEEDKEEEEKLELPPIIKRRKVKSHFDILKIISKNLSDEITKSPQKSFIFSEEKDIDKEKDRDKDKFIENEPPKKFIYNLIHDNSEINKSRFKKKNLSPKLDDPKFNNNRMLPQAQIFMKNFFSQCNYQSENANIVLREINKSTIHTSKDLENKKQLRKLAGIANQDVEKKQFMEGRKNGKTRNVKLLGPPIPGINKFILGDKNDVILIGDVIEKCTEKFASDCKDTLNQRIDEYDPEMIEKKKLKIIQDDMKRRRKKQDFNSLQIEEGLKEIEKRKIKLLEDLRKLRQKEKREK